VLAAVASLGVAHTRALPSSTPKFADYPVEVFRGSKPPLQLTEEQEYWRRTYDDAREQEPNFAGRYVLHGAPIGCCGDVPIVMLGLDLSTGKPIDVDIRQGDAFKDCAPKYKDRAGKRVRAAYYYRAESRLIVVTGAAPGDRCLVEFFVENGGSLKLVHQAEMEPKA